ncbi:MAG: hypothetical protein ACRD3I_05460, partial [Terriglobales bacterium]
MARTEIPHSTNDPASPSSGWGGLAGPAPRRAPVYDVPTLLLELDDERTRSRRREGMLVSIIVHLVALFAILLLPKYLPMRPLIASPTTEDMLRGRDLTYLAPPPDTQAPPVKAPDTNVISDKN